MKRASSLRKSAEHAKAGVESLFTPAQAAKTLMVLGLLMPGAKHGYELHRIVVAHGALYADFKKPTLYHLLQRLTRQGAVKVRAEGGARGPRGERLVYELTDSGRQLFHALIRAILGSYDTAHTGLEVAAVFLSRISAREALTLIEKRRAVVCARRETMSAELGPIGRLASAKRIAAGYLASDHALSLMDAEIKWIDRVRHHLASAGPRRACAARRPTGTRSAPPASSSRKRDPT